VVASNFLLGNDDLSDLDLLLRKLMIEGILEQILIIDHARVAAPAYLRVVLPQLPDEPDLVRVAVDEEDLEVIQVVVFEQIVNEGVGCQGLRLKLRAVETRGQNFLGWLYVLLEGLREVQGEQTAEEHGQESGFLEDAEGLCQQVEAGVQL
jgi:hypothetical protein